MTVMKEAFSRAGIEQLDSALYARVYRGDVSVASRLVRERGQHFLVGRDRQRHDGRPARDF
jgi:hypothetical protein